MAKTCRGFRVRRKNAMRKSERTTGDVREIAWSQHGQTMSDAGHLLRGSPSADKATDSPHNHDMAPTPSTVSFTVRRPTPVSRPSSSGPESDGPFKFPALPRHLASGASSATGSPLAGSPRTFSSREDSDDDGETGIVFANGSVADDNMHHMDSSDEENFVASSGQRCVIRNRSSCSIEVDSHKLSYMIDFTRKRTRDLPKRHH